MSQPTLHSRAAGIHPASFVQPTEPPTADLQDGTEWTDTSAGPPYVRKVWRTGTHTWDVLQMDPTGYPLPGGARIQSYDVDLTPTVPPTVEAVARSSGAAALPAGRYYFAYTYVTHDSLETPPSPSSPVNVDGTQFVRFHAPPLPAGVPRGFIRDVEVYLVAPLPTVSGVYIGLIDDMGSDPYRDFPNYAALPGRPQPPTTPLYYFTAVGILDPTGTTILSLPLGNLSRSPDTLVGQDPDSALPAFCPQPQQPASGSKQTPPATGTDCTQTRCGAALAMTQHLEDLYDTWRTWINAAIGAVASLAIDIILDWLAAFIGALVVAERIASSTLTVFNNLRPLLAALTGVELSSALPVWDSTTVDNVQRVFFATLQCTGMDVSVSAGDMTNVAGYIRANTASFLGNIVSELLALSCEYSALTDWQAKITGATPSGLCAGY